MKVVEGLELLRSLSINLGCASQNMSFDDCYVPWIGELRREDGFSNPTNSKTRCRHFWAMFRGNVPLIIKDVTYNISFNLGMKQIEIPKPKELKHGTLSVLRISFIPFSCHFLVENCATQFFCEITTFTSRPLSLDKLPISNMNFIIVLFMTLNFKPNFLLEAG